MKVYHYAKIKSWHDIKHGSWKSGDKPGLGASLRVGQSDQEAWETTAIFGLLEAQPKEWKENQAFPKIWDKLKNKIGEAVLLEVLIDHEDDEHVFVLDGGHIVESWYEDKSAIPPPIPTQRFYRCRA